MRQIEFAMFDMKLYMANPAISDYQNLLEEIRQETSVLSPPPYNRFANSFSHIFAGGYAAGYYSYKWAEVLSCDAYAAFEEEGGANSSLGQKFWQEILAVGGSRPAKESFIAFRGREPSIDALLRLSGLMPQHTAQTV
jgi:oligopeptidase A